MRLDDMRCYTGVFFLFFLNSIFFKFEYFENLTLYEFELSSLTSYSFFKCAAKYKNCNI